MKHKHAEESWKAVVFFEGSYEVSNFGRIKSIERTRVNAGKIQKVAERILVNAQANYPSVSLWKEGILKVKKVHRIVAEAWIPNPEHKPEVNHIDANRLNNCVDNLEWVTRKENVKHAVNSNLMPSGENHPNSKLSNVDIESIRLSTEPQKQLAEKYGCSQGLISMIKNKLIWRGV